MMMLIFSDSVKSEEIKEEAEYSGIRVRLTVKIGIARNTIQIDFGFGDIAIPQPLLMDYPTLLNNKSAKVLAYSKEAIVHKSLRHDPGSCPPQK